MEITVKFSSSQPFDSQERCELRLENENLLTSSEALRHLDNSIVW